jgi:hypothetical protein
MSDNFDEEIERVRLHLEKKMTELVDERFKELERKQLLRLRGQQYCRICQNNVGIELEPPASDDEYMFHRTNHGDAMQNVPRPRNWPDVERIDAEQKKRAGR